MASPQDQTSRAKARARVALRAERAFGLDAIPAPPARPASIQGPGGQVPTMPSARTTAARVEAAPKSAALAPVDSILLPVSAGLIAPVVHGPFTAPILPSDEKRKRLKQMDEAEVRGCKLCRLCETRTHTVFGEGDADAKIFFIGEGPGENEDLSGRPFVGRAGQLLDKMIAAMGLRRDQVMIVNIVKCRPPNNRVPAPDEVATCTPYLERQLEIVRPRAIVTLGLPAAKYMLQTNSTMGKLRGTWHAWRGIKLMPTFHPAYILRSYTEQTRAAVWSDLKMVMAEVGLAPPARADRTAD